MIIGIGVDIIEISRIKEAVGKYGDNFLKRVYTAKEIKYCQRRYHQLAVRFAAKEAYAKAIGTGITNINWHDIEVVNNRSGKPGLAIKGTIKKKVHVSLSHSRDYAVASVYVEK